jgi:hypothetical protein
MPDDNKLHCDEGWDLYEGKCWKVTYESEWGSSETIGTFKWQTDDVSNPDGSTCHSSLNVSPASTTCTKPAKRSE